MNYHQLGNSSLQVSEISMGCMSMKGTDQDWATIINRAIESGINSFDTADLYDHGENEIALGKALGHKRKEVLITSKAGNQWRSDGTGWDWNPGKNYILQCANDSLKRLNTEWIDLFLLHGGTIEDPIDETIEAFEILMRQGKIRFYGISSIRPNVIREYIKRSSICSVMMQYSLLDRRPEESCFELIEQAGLSVLVRGSVAKGLLVDKTATAFLNYSAEQVEKEKDAVNALSGETRTPAQTAIQWVLRMPVVASAVVGIRTSGQLDDAVHAMNTKTLQQSEVETLNGMLPINFYEQHR